MWNNVNITSASWCVTQKYVHAMGEGGERNGGGGRGVITMLVCVGNYKLM